MSSTLDNLRRSCHGISHLGADYDAKQFGAVPDAPVVDRAAFLLGKATGKVILDVGASGEMSAALRKVASVYHGLDRPDRDRGISDVLGIDLDDCNAELPRFPGMQLVICGEVLEHLSNPGQFLDKLRRDYPGVETVITVPNAYTDAGRKWLERGWENCNQFHCAYYSHRTLSTLLRRHGWEPKEWAWYNGRAKFSEGIICVAGPGSPDDRHRFKG